MQCSGFERLAVKDLGSGPRLLFAGVVYRSCRSGTGSTVLNIRGPDIMWGGNKRSDQYLHAILNSKQAL